MHTEEQVGGIAGAVVGLQTELVAFRRHLHAHPELSWREHETTRLLRDRLIAAGLEPRVADGGTGLTCDIGTDGPIVALRGDIDALPIADAKQVPYRSTVDGESWGPRCSSQPSRTSDSVFASAMASA